jgi:(p)ppGpp synthase/HD superfamily hydrolase
MLEKAIIIATNAHKGQVDKAGKPYILHSLRVMFSRRNETERIEKYREAEKRIVEVLKADGDEELI